LKKTCTLTGIDIGSSKIAAVTARVDDKGLFDIISQASVPSRGIARGVPADMGAAVGSLSRVFDKLGASGARKAGDIYVNISGEDVRGTRTSGMIPLSVRGREVIAADMTRCVDAASTIHLPFDREVIHKAVQNFSIDDQPPIKNPLGLYASRLSCEAYVVTANLNHIQSVYKCVNDAGYDVKEMVFTGIAEGAGLLEKPDMDSGTAVIDIGSGITELSVFSGGAFAALRIFPIGAQDIAGDFREDVAFRSLYSSIGSGLEELSASSGKISSIILTGGMALADGMIEFLEEKLAYPIKLGISRGLRGEVSGLDSARLSAAIGLARYAYEKRLAAGSGALRRFSEKVTDLFNSYF